MSSIGRPEHYLLEYVYSARLVQNNQSTNMYRIVGIRSRPQIEALVKLTFYLVNFDQKLRQNV